MFPNYKITAPFAAIDPGQFGGLVIFRPGDIELHPFGGQGNDAGFAAQMIKLIPQNIPIYIEGVHFIGGGRANAGTFDLIRGVGAIEGAAWMRSDKVRLIDPGKWTKVIKASVSRTKPDSKANPRWKAASRAIANGYISRMGLGDFKFDDENDGKKTYCCSEAALIGIFGAKQDDLLVVEKRAIAVAAR